MKSHPFRQVDVFTRTALKGNPLAVVHDAAGLSDAAMQAFTNWTNLSEATFLSAPKAPTADYAVRIFCPGRELPFAGHPTLGSCHAWLEAGGKPKGDLIVQECGIGLVSIRRDADTGRLSFAAPSLKRSGPLDEADVALIARGIGLARGEIVAHAWCDNGPGWRGVLLRSAAQVLAIKPDAAILGRLDIGVVGPRGKVGLVAPREPDGGADFEVRAFFPGNSGMAEDPVTGSLNAAIAQWLIGAGLAPPRYVAAQGAALGRDGRVFIEKEGDTIWVGGHSVTVVRGEVSM